MKLYLVARWGNDRQGPDGDDTLFLIRAATAENAAGKADAALAGLGERNVRPHANWVCEIGVDIGGMDGEEILQGPFPGISAANEYTRVWTRERPDESWQFRQPPCPAPPD